MSELPENLRREAAELRDIIRGVIKELDDHHKNKNIAATVGSGVSVLGGVLAVAGAILAVPTAGLALPLAAAGSIMAGAGSVVCLGASLVEFIIEKYDLSYAQERWEKFQTDFKSRCPEFSYSEKLLDTIPDIVGNITNDTEVKNKKSQLFNDSCGPVGAAARAAMAAVGPNAGRAVAPRAAGIAVGRAVAPKAAGMAVGRAVAPKAAGIAVGVSEGSKAAGKAVGRAVGPKAVGKALVRGFIILDVILITINLKDLVRSAAALRNGEPSQASARLETMVEFLDWVASGEGIIDVNDGF